jgi:hypothetical protein
MTLPYDYARRSGNAGAATSTPHPDCIACLRRTSPGRPEGWQAYIAPHAGPGPCPHRIGETT